MSPTFVMFPSDTSRDPQAILLLPLSISPKPEVIEPAFKAPTSTTFATVVMEACVAPVTVAAVVAVSALPVKSPVNTPAIAPVPVIVGLVKVLFVKVFVVDEK